MPTQTHTDTPQPHTASHIETATDIHAHAQPHLDGVWHGQRGHTVTATATSTHPHSATHTNRQTHTHLDGVWHGQRDHIATHTHAHTCTPTATNPHSHTQAHTVTHSHTPGWSLAWPVRLQQYWHCFHQWLVQRQASQELHLLPTTVGTSRR